MQMMDFCVGVDNSVLSRSSCLRLTVIPSAVDMTCEIIFAIDKCFESDLVSMEC